MKAWSNRACDACGQTRTCVEVFVKAGGSGMICKNCSEQISSAHATEAKRKAEWLASPEGVAWKAANPMRNPGRAPEPPPQDDSDIPF